MKNKLLYFSFILFIGACGILSRSKDKIDFYNDGKKYKYRYCIPKGYDSIVIISNHQKTKIYYYNDSAVFFIGGDEYLFIDLSDDEYLEKLISVNANKDTLTFKGIDLSNKFWKVKYFSNGLVVGYSRVKKTNKLKFDKCLSSVKGKDLFPKQNYIKNCFVSSLVIDNKNLYKILENIILLKDKYLNDSTINFTLYIILKVIGDTIDVFLSAENKWVYYGADRIYGAIKIKDNIFIFEGDTTKIKTLNIRKDVNKFYLPDCNKFLNKKVELGKIYINNKQLYFLAD